MPDRIRLREARQRAAAAHGQSAAAHEQAATMFDRFGRLADAQRHRDAAQVDRDAAAARSGAVSADRLKSGGALPDGLPPVRGCDLAAPRRATGRSCVTRREEVGTLQAGWRGRRPSPATGTPSRLREARERAERRRESVVDVAGPMVRLERRCEKLGQVKQDWLGPRTAPCGTRATSAQDRRKPPLVRGVPERYRIPDSNRCYRRERAAS
jgi:hypothetical protein